MKKKDLELLTSIENSVNLAARFTLHTGSISHDEFLATLKGDKPLQDMIQELALSALVDIVVDFDENKEVRITCTDLSKDKVKLQYRSNGDMKVISAIIKSVPIVISVSKKDKFEFSNSEIKVAIKGLLALMEADEFPSAKDMTEEVSFDGKEVFDFLNPPFVEAASESNEENLDAADFDGVPKISEESLTSTEASVDASSLPATEANVDASSLVAETNVDASSLAAETNVDASSLAAETSVDATSLAAETSVDATSSPANEASTDSHEASADASISQAANVASVDESRIEAT